MFRAAILSIISVLLAVWAAGCGSASSEAVHPPSSSRGVNHFIITEDEPATTPRSAYRSAHRECASSGLRWMAKAYGVRPVDREVAKVNAYGYRGDLRQFAEVGCFDGLAGRHRAVGSW